MTSQNYEVFADNRCVRRLEWTRPSPTDDRARFRVAGVEAHNQAVRCTLGFAAGNTTLTVK